MRDEMKAIRVTDAGDQVEMAPAWRRWAFVGALALALVAGGWKFMSWRSAQQRQQIATFEMQLSDASPALRVAAAEGMLRHDPANANFRMVRTRALIELGRHTEAREQLQVLIDQKSPDQFKFINLQTASFFSEAQWLLNTIDRDRTEPTVERVLALMTGVEKQAPLLAGNLEPFDRMMLDARRYQATIQARQFALQSRLRHLSKARATGVQQTVESLRLEVGELQQQVEADDQKLAEVCAKLTQLQPGNAEPVEMMFQHHLRRREFDQARGLARSLLAWLTVPAETVGRIADALFALETQFAVPVTAADIELAGRLLTHPKQSGKPSLQYELTKATYALHAGDPKEAHEIATRIRATDGLNVRALCIQTRAFVDAGDPERGVQLLQRFNEFMRYPMVRYTLGLAHLATNEPRQINLGQEALRQCLEIEPGHLPARLRLVESLATSGFILEAANDIAIAEQINPLHPRVLALKVHLAVESEDLGSLASLIEQQLGSSALVLEHDDVAMVVAMVLDDTQRVRDFAAGLGRTSPNDVFVLIANRWLAKEALQRARLAPVVVRSLHSFLDRDPLQSPNRPRLPQTGALATSKSAGAAPPPIDRLEPLTNVHFLPRPLDVALESVEIALDQWPATPTLLSMAAEINIWLGRPAAARQWLKRMPPDVRAAAADSVDALMALYLDARFDDLRESLRSIAAKPAAVPAPMHRWFDLDLALRGQDAKQVADALTRLLTAHPWAELPLLVTVADALRRDQPDRAYAVLGLAEGINPQLAHLARARLNLGLGRAADALHDVEKAVAAENAGTEPRRWAAEVRVRAFLLLDQSPMAITTLDQLAHTLTEHHKDASLATADVLVAFGKPAAAAEVLAGLLTDTTNAPRLLDRMLARAETVMKPTRLRSLIEALLGQRANDPVLLLYQARVVAADDDVVAERLVRRVLTLKPKAPRAMMELAELLRLLQPDEARRIYKELSLRGGRSAEAAQQVLDSMNGREPKSPTSALFFLDGATE